MPLKLGHWLFLVLQQLLVLDSSCNMGAADFRIVGLHDCVSQFLIINQTHTHTHIFCSVALENLCHTVKKHHHGDPN